MDLKELENGIDPEVHWYYQSKKLPLYSFIKKIIRKNNNPVTVVDVGAGSGFFSVSLDRDMPNNIKKVYLVDIGYTNDELQATAADKIQKTLRIPDKIENSIVILMDVLEHLEDDLKMLQDIKKACTGDNNHFFITVPAFNSLWSKHDVYLGHYRRYKIATLTQVLQKAGYTINNSYYLYGGLFPMVWAVRQLNNLRKKDASNSDMRPFNKFTNSVLHNFCAAEMKIAGANKVFGVTCVAQGKI